MTILITLNLIPSNHPFFKLFLPKIKPPMKKEMIVEIVKNIFKVFEENHPIYSKKVNKKIKTKKITKLNNSEIPIFFK